MAITVQVITHTSPRLIKIPAPTTTVSIQDLTDAIKDWEDEPANLSYPQLVKTSGKEDLGGGVFVGLTAELQDAQVYFEARTESDSVGTITTSDTIGTTLIDSAATFITDGINPGDTILNMTDGSAATVLTIDSETQITHFPLDDGTDNDWDFGDSYKIWNKVECEINGGNLVAVDSLGTTISAFLPTAFTHVVRTSASSATLQEQADIRYSSFQNGVWVDVINGTAGTAFPTGTPRQPVSNLTDAQTIADTRGFKIIYVMESLTVGAGPTHEDMLFIGRSPKTTTITIDAAADVTDCEYQDALVTGTLDGSCYITACAVKNLMFISGHLERCVLREGTVTLAGTGIGMFNRCSSVSADDAGVDIPVIDFNGSGQTVALQGFDGSVRLQNKSGAADNVEINLAAGKVWIDSDVTAGILNIRGVGEVVDNSVGATVNTDGLLNKALISDAVWDETASEHLSAGSTGSRLSDIHGHIRRSIFIDTSAITNGNGYQQTPYNNLTDAIDEAESEKLLTLQLEADATIDRNISNFEILGIDLPTVDLAGFDFKNVIIRECDVTGTQGTGQSPLLLLTCSMTNIVDFNGSGLTVTTIGTVSIADSAVVFLNEVATFLPTSSVTLDLKAGATGSTATFQNVSGDFTLTNVDHAYDTVAIFFRQGKLTIDATCTAGNIVVGGNVVIVDNSIGSTVDITAVSSSVIADQVWDETASDHETTGSTGKKLKDARDKALLGWINTV